MSIWLHSHAEPIGGLAKHGTECVYCAAQQTRYEDDKSELRRDHYSNVRQHVAVCPSCGWWKARIDSGWFYLPATSDGGGSKVREGAAILRQFDLSDIRSPVDEVRRYLLAKFDSRFDLHPRLFEETVASVFRDLGYSAVATAYSGDGGIDVILQKEDVTIGVQVKRYRASIAVEQIRALVGALVIKGITRGVFVTTSRFQSGAERTTSRLATRGIAVELIDAVRFYEALKITSRPAFSSLAEFLDCYDLSMLPEAEPEQGIAGQ